MYLYCPKKLLIHNLITTKKLLEQERKTVKKMNKSRDAAAKKNRYKWSWDK